MKKNLLRVLAMITAIAMVVVAFAACDKNNDTTTQASSEAIATIETTTGESATGESTTTEVKPVEVPKDQAGMLKLFNEQATNLKATAYSRKMTKGELEIPSVGFNLNFMTDEQVAPKIGTHFNGNSTADASVLPQLSADQIAKVSSQADGFTIELKEVTSGQAQPGLGGYANVINQDKATALIIATADGFEIDIYGAKVPLKASMLTVNGINSTMSAGKYIVKMKDGKISSVDFSCNQHAIIDATGKALMIKAGIEGFADIALTGKYA